MSAATSFYALHELYIFALDNTPILPREQLSAKPHLKKFSVHKLEFYRLYFASSADATHSQVHSLARRDGRATRDRCIGYGCEAIVAYDHDFSAISDIIPHKAFEDYL